MLSPDPAGILLVALLVGLYVRAVRVLGARGYRVGRGQQALWCTGVALVAIGLLGPLDRLAEDLLLSHMAQHLLVGDIAAPFLLAGMRSPVMLFMLPKPFLANVARRRRLRALFRFLGRPLVALPLYVAVLYTWHLSFAFDAAMRHEWAHGLQHQTFMLAAAAVWWPAIEPQRQRMPGELWKAGYILGSRVLAMFVGMALMLSRTPAYEWYADRGGSHGLSPVDDQQLAGGLMLSVDIVIMLAALAFFFWRAGVQADRDDASAAVTRSGSTTPPRTRSA